MPCGPYIPDFLTPAVDGGNADLRQGVDRVLSTPRSRLRREFTLLAESEARTLPLRGPGPETRVRPFAAEQLARGDAAALRALGGLLTAYDAAFVAPYRPWIDAAVASDVAWRSRELAAGGVRALLETFRPMARWSPPVLEVTYPVERDLHLAGRGLLLVPSYFCWRKPITLFDGALLPVLVYPVEKPVQPPAAASDASLARLLGPTAPRSCTRSPCAAAPRHPNWPSRWAARSPTPASNWRSCARRASPPAARRAGACSTTPRRWGADCWRRPGTARRRDRCRCPGPRRFPPDEGPRRFHPDERVRREWPVRCHASVIRATGLREGTPQGGRPDRPESPVPQGSAGSRGPGQGGTTCAVSYERQ
ncbi:hypothetical protein SMICM17S_10082 [Streptomyces microflavus]